MSDQTPTNNTDRLVTTGDFPKCLCCGRTFISGGDLCKACEKYVHRYTQKMVLAELRAIDPKADYLIKDQVVSVADRITTIEKEMGES